MSDKKYSDDPQVTALTGVEKIPTAQGDLDKYSTPLDLAVYALAYVVANFTGNTLITSTGIITIGTWKSRITKRETSVVSTASVSINVDNYDVYAISALAANINFLATSGTPTRFQELLISITDDGTPRTIGFDASFNFSATLPSPAVTVSGETVYFKFLWNATANEWDCIDIKGGY